MSKKKQAGRGTPATVMLQRSGTPHTVHPYEHNPDAESYGLEAAHALGVPPERVFKTLLADVDGGRLVVGIVPVSGSLDLKSLASAVGGKRATMADIADAERVTGYVAGGISPLGQRKRLPTVIDDTATAYETIYVSGGRRGLDIELAPAQLIELTGATTAQIARPGFAS
ncbi:Cys-tRNA(Pro) deacylase [Phytoactinopolyspora mesophila]|uniref:Cys-tRNA(Pro)/Cys-tRNA(Cys) deacylase n=1 Tax=Phytoactinopolyspora mesophila TaxID=2650750 RepID=A0A7K3M7B7_9ACTN|nr:Cys-tRNA(Pro) deacylase [Phytoactinopolyspora mesophila]NDL59175.1 Cys-tRNA(Pro) deacylase [Phytoactinopolyspora mesophila]